MVRIVILRLMESYFRHRWLNLLPILITTLVGVVFVVTATPQYVAKGQIFVQNDTLLAALTSSNNSSSWWVSAAQVTTSEIYELMGTKAFVRSIIQKTDLEKNMSAGPEAVDITITYVRDAVSISPLSDKLVDITATSDDPKLAHQMVIATMDAYVQWKINSAYQESVAARTFFEGLIQPYTDQVDTARNDLMNFLDLYPEPVRGVRSPAEQMELERLQSALRSTEEQLKSAQDNEENARLSLAQTESVTRQTYLVIDQPEMPREPEISMKSMIQDVVIFTVVGIFLSIVGIAAGAVIDRSLRFPVDVRHGLSLPVLAMVPVNKVILPTGATADQPITPATTSMPNPQENTQAETALLQS